MRSSIGNAYASSPATFGEVIVQHWQTQVEMAAAKKRGPAPKLQQQIERIQQLPRTQQRFVMPMLDAVIAHDSR